MENQSMKTIILAILALGMSALVPAMRAAEKGAEPAVISHGAKVKLADNLVTGNITVFDFSSKYCPSCVELAPGLDRLHTKVLNLAVVEVDINRPSITGIDWKSPVAQQYNLHEIPHIKIYDANGKLVAEGDKALKQIQGAIRIMVGEHIYSPKFQQLEIKKDKDGPSFVFSSVDIVGKPAILPSTKYVPHFKNADANEYVKTYSEFVNEILAACNARDAAKLKALAPSLQDWAAKADAVFKNLKGAGAVKFVDWDSWATGEMSAAIDMAKADMNKGKKGGKGKGGKGKGKAKSSAPADNAESPADANKQSSE